METPQNKYRACSLLDICLPFPIAVVDLCSHYSQELNLVGKLHTLDVIADFHTSFFINKATGVVRQFTVTFANDALDCLVHEQKTGIWVGDAFDWIDLDAGVVTKDHFVGSKSVWRNTGIGFSCTIEFPIDITIWNQQSVSIISVGIQLALYFSKTETSCLIWKDHWLACTTVFMGNAALIGTRGCVDVFKIEDVFQKMTLNLPVQNMCPSCSLIIPCPTLYRNYSLMCNCQVERIYILSTTSFFCITSHCMTYWRDGKFYDCFDKITLPSVARKMFHMSDGQFVCIFRNEVGFLSANVNQWCYKTWQKKSSPVCDLWDFDGFQIDDGSIFVFSSGTKLIQYHVSDCAASVRNIVS